MLKINISSRENTCHSNIDFDDVKQKEVAMAIMELEKIKLELLEIDFVDFEVRDDG